ncbi:polymorphic toxin-type HINT domain-containing protein [Streptomyces griseus]|uniref:polymorphic toxin-type HINT domain-containing protein n=1 Tax=Streptomyces griseus TaxID=1911 RepID=UPI00381B8DDE
MDLTPVTGSAADTMFDTLVDYTKQLKDATDQGISFSLDSAGDLKCGPSGCTASTSFTGKVYGKAKTRIVGGQVTAVMTAVFTIDGKNAGRCTSKPVALPVKANRASGKLSYSNPGAGPVYASIAAQYKAQAETQSRASGGRTIRYTIPNRATTEIDARALAAVEVKQLVGEAKRERNAANCAKPHSFPPGTRVLISNGLSVPIESVRRGDQVMATDPATGLTAPRTVTHTFTTQADKSFTRLTTASGQITATDTHPFWLDDERRWTDAGEISAGDLLREPSGSTLPVLSVARFTQRQTTHDLTVADLHTYYVLAGQTPVLVHNSNCDVAGRGLWRLTKEGSTKLLKGGPFNTTFYKSAADGTWWTPDVTGHGESAFKVYRETSKVLAWISDADKYGDYITEKWKGDTGIFIPNNNLRGVKR